MPFIALIPARLASTRLPGKPLADIGGLPMVVRVARRAQASGAQQVVIAADAPAIVEAAHRHGVEAVLTREDHVSGTDRLAEAAQLLGLQDDAVVVNVQGDEPLIEPAVISAVAKALSDDAQSWMATAAHPIETLSDYRNPNVVKVVTDRHGRALYFSRAPIPWERDAPASLVQSDASHDGLSGNLLAAPVLRHVGLYAYRAGFLRAYPQLEASPLERLESLEQLRALWHGFPIQVLRLSQAPHAGVDTPEDLARVRALIAAGPV